MIHPVSTLRAHTHNAILLSITPFVAPVKSNPCRTGTVVFSCLGRVLKVKLFKFIPTSRPLLPACLRRCLLTAAAPANRTQFRCPKSALLQASIFLRGDIFKRPNLLYYREGMLVLGSEILVWHNSCKGNVRCVKMIEIVSAYSSSKTHQQFFFCTVLGLINGF